MAAQDISNTTNLNKAQYMKDALPLLRYHQVFDKFGQSDEIKERNGNSFTWIKFNKFGTTTDDYTTNQTGNSPDWAPVDPGSNLITLAPDYLFGKGTEWNSFREYTSWTDLPKNMREGLMLQAAEVLDHRYATVLKAGTQVIYASNRTARNQLISTDVITMKDIFRGAEYLKANGVQPLSKSGKYACAISPATEYSLLLDSTFRDLVEHSRPDDLFKGKLGVLGNVEFWLAEEAPYEASSGSASSVSKVDQTLMFGEGGYGIGKVMFDNFQIIYTAPGNGNGGGAHGDEYANKHKLTWKAATKAVILEDKAILRIESARSSEVA